MNTQSASDKGHTDSSEAIDLRKALVEALGAFAPHWVKWVQRSAAPAGLSPARLRMLGALYTEGPQIMHDLSEWLGVTPRNVTALVDALEEDDLVVRRRHPSDRRATIVELTHQGRKITEAWWDEHIERSSEIFGELAERDQRTLLRILGELEVAFGARVNDDA